MEDHRTSHFSVLIGRIGERRRMHDAEAVESLLDLTRGQAPLFDDPFAVGARRDDPHASKNRNSRARVASYPWIIGHHGTPIRTRFEELFDTHTGLCPTSIVESSSLVLIRGVLLNSDRLTILSARQTRYEVARRTLRFCLHRTLNRIRHQPGCGWGQT